MNSALNKTKDAEVPVADPVWLQVVRNQVSGLRFGLVQITVHEGRVVQVERTEKIRFDKAAQD